MSVSTPKTRQRPRWLPPVLLIGAFLVVAMLSNRAQVTKTPEGLGIVADDLAYRNSVDQAHQLSEEALKKYQDGAPLSPTDVVNVQHAAKLLDEANLYKPKEVGPFMLSGMAHMALGEYEKAIEKLNQGIVNVGDRHTPENFTAVIVAHYELSECYFEQGKYVQAYLQAAAASESIPNSAPYLIARAKAALQMETVPNGKELIAKKMKIDPKALDFGREAKLEVGLALKLSPNYKPAIVLGKYLLGAKAVAPAPSP